MSSNGSQSPLPWTSNDQRLIQEALDQAMLSPVFDLDTSPAPGGLGRSEAPLAANVIAGYEIRREIHRGAQGVVYEAIQTATGMRVAIKAMRERSFGSAGDR